MRESLAVSHTVFVIPFLIRRTHPVLSILSVEAIRNSRERIKKTSGVPAIWEEPWSRVTRDAKSGMARPPFHA